MMIPKCYVENEKKIKLVIELKKLIFYENIHMVFAG